MADSVVDRDELQIINEENTKEKCFKCCQTKQSKILVCVNCGNIFHISCAVKNKLKCVKLDDTRIKCCATNELSTNTSEDKYQQVLAENALLKMIIEEKDEKYKLLLDNNKLLVQNNNLLQTNINQQKPISNKDKKTEQKTPEPRRKNQGHTEKQTDLIKNNVNTEGQKQRNLMNNIIYIDQDKHTSVVQTPQITETLNVNDVQDKHLTDSQNIADQNQGEWHLQKSRKKRNSENVAKNNVMEISQQNSDGGFQVMGNRKRNQNRKIIKQFGSNENDEDFGVERKVWLYLYRIKRHVTSQKIHDYVKKQEKFKNTDVIVKELPTDEHQNKCFMFGVDESLKDEVYRQSMWPRTIAFKRFDFRRYNNYQKNNQDF